MNNFLRIMICVSPFFYLAVNAQDSTQQRDALQERRGLVKDKGVWKSRQQIEVEMFLEEQKKNDNDWKRKIKSLCKALPNRNAEDGLMEITDPAAGIHLSEAIANEKDIDKKMILLRAIANIPDRKAALLLAETSMNPKEHAAVRRVCVAELHRIVTLPALRPTVIAAYCRYLHPETFQPPVINEAGRIIGELGLTEGISALIDAVVTFHKYKYTEDTDTNSFSGSGGVHFSKGTRTVKGQFDCLNQGVLSALKKLTVADYGFDQQSWRNWYDEQQRTPPFNLRRI